MVLFADTQLDATSLMFLAGVVIVVTMIMISTRRRAADRGHSPRAYAREQISQLREQDQMHDDMTELMVQLEKLARQINAQVDTRFAKLEKAIADADARLAELRRLGLGEPERDDERAGRPEPDATRSDAISPSPADSEIAAGSVEGVAGPADRPHGPSEEQEAFRREVLELADAGRTPIEIARELGRDVGEVELVIKLNPRDQST